MKNKKHSSEFKIMIVNEYLNHEGGYQYLGEKYDIDKSLVRSWVNQFNEFGYEGLLKSMSKTQYTSEFKFSVLKYREENKLSYRETANHFGIKQRSTIASWNRKLREGGLKALEGKLGRPRKHMSKKESSNNKKLNSKSLNETEREELERLRHENRMKDLEILALKKLNALPIDPTNNSRR